MLKKSNSLLFATPISPPNTSFLISNYPPQLFKLSATRDSSDGSSSISDKTSLHISTETCAQLDDPEPSYPGPASSSSNPPSPRPPPFSSLYFPPSASSQQAQPSKVLVTEPDPSAPPAFSQVPALESQAALSTAEAELKAALPQDSKVGESSTAGKGAEDAEPPPPYTEGSSPLDDFQYVMSAAGGAASIITQVQQGGPAPVNTLTGKDQTIDPTFRKLWLNPGCRCERR